MSDQRTVPAPSIILSRKRRGDFLALMVVLILFALVLLTLLPIWSSRAAADSSLPANLHAKTTADYSRDPLGTLHPAVGLGIIEAILQDENPFASDIDERMAAMTEGIALPVPTSTAVPPTSAGGRTSVPTASASLPPTATETAATLAVPSATAGIVGVTGTAAQPPTRTVTLPPGVTPSRTLTPTRTVTLPPGVTPSMTRTPTRTVTLPPGVTPSMTRTPTRTVTLPPGVTPSMTRTPTRTVTPSPTATANQAACETYPSSGFVAIKDTWIDSDKPSTSNEDAPKLEIEPGTKEKDALIQFDLSTIPAGSTVQSATLYINVTKTSNYTVEFREVFTEWSENVTWETQPDYDFSFVSGSLELNPNQGGNCVRSVSVDIELIEYWIDNPDLNFGFILMAADGADKTDYSSIESTRPPRLVIVYNQ